MYSCVCLVFGLNWLPLELLTLKVNFGLGVGLAQDLRGLGYSHLSSPNGIGLHWLHYCVPAQWQQVFLMESAADFSNAAHLLSIDGGKVKVKVPLDKLSSCVRL